MPDNQQWQARMTAHMEGTLGGAELDAFLEWVDDPANEDAVRSVIAVLAEQSRERQSFREADIRLIVDGILKPQPVKVIRGSFIKRAIAVAAAVVIVAASWWLLQSPGGDDAAPTARVEVKTDVAAPTATKAIIKLADGRTVSLDSLNGALAAGGGMEVVKNENGEIVYTGEGGTLAYNTLSNPRGSQVVNLMLADGTKVWLNAASSVTYPVSFPGNERKVEITGEAYFEVARDARRPFFVRSQNQEIRVLGTHFNVNTYADEDAVRTTLLEGSVSVQVINTNKQVLLKPGDQSVLSGQDVLRTMQPDLAAVMAWKNGSFYFNDADIATVMRQLSRWYDVDISYEGKVPAKLFKGEIDRTLPISKVLDVLAYVGVRARVEGRKVIVMQ